MAFAADGADACRRVLEEVLNEPDVNRALVLLRHDGVPYADGYGFAPDVVSELGDPSSDVHRYLAERIDSGDPGSVGSTGPPVLQDGSFVVIPFPGPSGVPVGCVVMDGGVEPPGLARSLQLVGPVVARARALDVLAEKAERLGRRDQLLSTVVDSLSDPVVLTDNSHDFFYANKRAEKLFGSRAHDSDGRRRAVQVNDLLFSSFLMQSVTNEGPASRELNLVDPGDGSDLLFEVISIPMPPAVREEGAVISVLRDITDLKRAVSELEVQFNRSRMAEQAARRESDRLNVIIGNAGDPILVTDGDSKIILMNVEAERLFDVPESEENGEGAAAGRAVRANDTKFTTLISDFLLQDYEDHARRVQELVLTDPVTHEELPVEVVSSKISDHHGGVSAIVSVLHDLTQVVENKRLAWELRALNEGLEERIRLATEELEERNRRLEWQSRELEKASRLKSEFLASMSHELRTPINAMLGYTALVREEIYGPLNDQQHNALKKVHGSSQHLLALINDILDLSKIEAGRMPLWLEDVRIEGIVEELIQTVEPMIREKDVDLSTTVPEDLPTLHTDRTKVKQIVLNLLSNAVKFTHEGGVSLELGTMDDGARVSIVVKDTGIGIDEAHLHSIFDDFRQVDQSSTRKYGGTGLGLSITRKLVDLMGGSISVESHEGEGSTFRVELPVRVSPLQDEDERREMAFRSESSRKSDEAGG